MYEHDVAQKGGPLQASEQTGLPGDAPGIEQPENPLPGVSLGELPIPLQQAAARAGWKQLMQVQALALPYLLAGRDMMVQSRTGSGKTGVFLLPVLERLDPAKNVCQAMILAPTRELALQVEQDAEILFAGTGFKTAALYGGVGYGKQSDALRGGAQVVVGTPGRLLDHLLRRNFNLNELRLLSLDEADRMLSVGFYPDMKEIQRHLPKRRIPTYFFSATFPPQVLRLAGEFMPKPELLSLSYNQVHHVEAMDHIFYVAKSMEKDRVLARILESESPASAIIFCNTKANVHYLSEVLKGFGYNADELSADLSQARREEVLANLRKGRLRFLVATDVAARGIDIPELSHVILYEPPEEAELYIHRAGRTGRAGAGGTVISVVDIMEKMELQRIARQYKIHFVERVSPTDAELAPVVGERLASLLESRLRKVTGLQKERLRRFLPLAQKLAEEEDSALLLAMLLDQEYQAALHAPLPVPDSPAARPEPDGAERGDGRGKNPRRCRKNRVVAK